MLSPKFEEVKNLYGNVGELLNKMHWQEGKSVLQMARELSVCRDTIYRWMDAERIPHRNGSEANIVRMSKLSTEERKKLAAASHQKTKELVSEGIHPFQIRHKKYGTWNKGKTKENDAIAKKLSEDRMGSGNPAWERWEETPTFKDGRKSYRIWAFRRYGFQKACMVCGAKEKEGIKLHVHHIDGDRKNNKKDNLQVLCPKCHSRVHYLDGQRKARAINGRFI